MIVTIDGLSFQGKSYICEHLAKKVGFDSLSTGNFVRYIAFQYNLLFSEAEEEETILEKAVNLMEATSTDDIISCSGLNSPDTERTLQIVASHSFAFDRVVERIRSCGKTSNIIMDGRFTYDIFPDADLSFYLVSSSERRTRLVSETRGISMEKAAEYIAFRDSFEKNYIVPARVKRIILDDYQNTGEVINCLEKEIRDL